MLLEIVSKSGNCPPDGEYKRTPTANTNTDEGSQQILNRVLSEEIGTLLNRDTHQSVRLVFGQSFDSAGALGKRTEVTGPPLWGTFAVFSYRPPDIGPIARHISAYVDESTGLLKAINLHSELSRNATPTGDDSELLLKSTVERIVKGLGKGPVQYVVRESRDRTVYPDSPSVLDRFDTTTSSVVQQLSNIKILYSRTRITFASPVVGGLQRLLPRATWEENIWIISQ
jgi:hypothetical protein